MLYFKTDTICAVRCSSRRNLYVAVAVVTYSFAVQQFTKTFQLCRYPRLPSRFLAEKQYLTVKVVSPAIGHVEYIAQFGTFAVLLPVNGSFCRRQPYTVSYLKGKRRRFGDIHQLKAKTVLSRIFFSTAACNACQHHAAVHKTVTKQYVWFADADFLQSAAARKRTTRYGQY